jgi:hypothetical protein
MLYIKDEGRPFFFFKKTINNLTAETISNTAVCNAHECVCVCRLIITVAEKKRKIFFLSFFSYSNDFQLLGQAHLLKNVFIPASFFFLNNFLHFTFYLFVSFPRLVCLFVFVVFPFIVQHLIRSAWLLHFFFFLDS